MDIGHSGDAGHLAVPAPAGVQAAENVSTGAVRVTWQAVAGNVIYEVWRDPNGAQGNATRLGATAALSFEDATAQAGQAYTYWVRASNVVGWVSGFSTADWGCLALAVPADVTASAGSDTGRVTLVWTGVPGATRYEVRRSGSNVLAGAAAVATVTGLGWTDAPVVPGQVYWYWVRGLGASLPVGAFSAAAKGGTCPLPPGNVTATDGIYEDRVRVTWTAATGAASYEVRRAATNDADASSAVGTVAAPVTVFDDTEVTGRDGYWYWVRALNAEGWAGALAGGDRGGLVLPAPTGGTASRGTEAAGVLVSWQAVPGAVTYEVLRAETNSLAQALPVGTGTNTAYRDVNTEAGTWYWYWVRGLNADGVIGEAGTCGSGYRPLPAPVVWASTNVYHDHIDVGWSNVPSASAYRVWWDGVQMPDCTGTGFGISGLQAGRIYVCRVQALTGDLTNNLVGCATGSTHAIRFWLDASDGIYTGKVAVAMHGCCQYIQMRHLARVKKGTTQQTVLAEAPGTAFDDTNVAAGVQYEYQAINSADGASSMDIGHARCAIDLDIDSDNNNGLDAPARDETEEAQQNSTNYPGKLFGVHDDDADHDGIPGFADGYDRDGVVSPDDAESCRFVPVVLELPANADFGRACVTFVYDASDPAGVVSNADGTYTLPANGSLRLWRADWRGESPTNRLIRPPNSTGYSHFIPANRAFPVSELGFGLEHRVVTNFLEGVRPGAASLTVSIAPDGTNSIAGVPAADEVKVTVLKVDIATDINNDGTIDAADEPIEESGIGEVVRVNDADDSPGGEDDLQYMEVKIEPTLTQGVVWFTYDTAKVKIWPSLAQTPGTEIVSGSEASPNWNLGAGGTVPDHVYVEGVSTTAPNASVKVVLHVKVGGTECTNTILYTVTDQVGHYAYFAGIRDYLTEYRGPGVTAYKVFQDDVDAPGGGTVDFHLVAVRADKARMFLYDAYTAGDAAIYNVVSSLPGATIIANGTFFVDWPGSEGKTVGRVINSYTTLPISQDMGANPAKDVKGWFGQRDDHDFAQNAPNVEPTVPTVPYAPGDLRAAAGGLVAIYPTYSGKTIQQIITALLPVHGDWNQRPTHHMGLDTDEKVLFFMITPTGTDYGTPITLHEVMTQLVTSGADIIRGLDGGTSVALAHRDRLGNNLTVSGTPGNRHSSVPFERRVNNYIQVNLVP